MNETPRDIHSPMGCCSKCGHELTLYFYPRSGPALGNMKVCSNDDCAHSAAGIKRAQEAEFKRWRHQDR